jgi:hypothetical protein
MSGLSAAAMTFVPIVIAKTPTQGIHAADKARPAGKEHPKRRSRGKQVKSGDKTVAKRASSTAATTTATAVADVQFSQPKKSATTAEQSVGTGPATVPALKATASAWGAAAVERPLSLPTLEPSAANDISKGKPSQQQPAATSEPKKPSRSKNSKRRARDKVRGCLQLGMAECMCVIEERM